MKLLFDENLSPRLPRLLSDIYPGSAHVVALGINQTGDSGIWKYAKIRFHHHYQGLGLPRVERE
ncbi:MAG: DUF5615 family PIN-like protein [bacterium]|nr:DUF5615 family PIN-like protein [bacterium]